MNLEKIWITSQDEIKKHIGDTSYKLWFSPEKQKAFEFGDSWICFLVSDPSMGEFVQKAVWKKIAEFLMQETGQFIEYRYISNKKLKETTKTEKRKIKGIPEDKTFSNFVVGKCNQFAHATASAVAEHIENSPHNPLYIYGSTGLGKTHLLYAIANRAIEKQPDIQPLYVTAENFMNDMIYHINAKKMSLFREKYRNNCQLLLMDDIQFLQNKRGTQDEMFHVFEYLKGHGHQIVFTSDVLPKDINNLEPRLRTRFESGVLADMMPPDLETMLAIIQQKSEDQNIILPSDVSLYIAKSVNGNIREIEGAINRLKAIQDMNQGAIINIQFAKNHLSSILHTSHQQDLSPDNIIKNVADAYNLRVSDLKGKKRSRNFTVPRHIAMYLIREYTNHSYPEIGRLLGGRDHTTIMSGCTKIKKAIQTDPNIRTIIELIERNL